MHVILVTPQGLINIVTAVRMFSHPQFFLLVFLRVSRHNLGGGGRDYVKPPPAGIAVRGGRGVGGGGGGGAGAVAAAPAAAVRIRAPRHRGRLLAEAVPLVAELQGVEPDSHTHEK